MKLYGYFRSSAAYRVRIALSIKGLHYSYMAVHLRGGEQFAAEYRSLNRQGLLPTLTDGPEVLTQSLAIVEYLDEVYPRPSLLPDDPVGRARVRALALAVACDIHPLNNLRVLNYLKDELAVDDSGRAAWYAHWVGEGFGALDAMLASDSRTGRFCHGDQPGLADCCLIPQIFNARRFGCDMSPYPTLCRIDEACRSLPAFQAAEPGRQPDAE